MCVARIIDVTCAALAGDTRTGLTWDLLAQAPSEPRPRVLPSYRSREMRADDEGLCPQGTISVSRGLAKADASRVGGWVRCLACGWRMADLLQAPGPIRGGRLMGKQIDQRLENRESKGEADLFCVFWAS